MTTQLKLPLLNATPSDEYLDTERLRLAASVRSPRTIATYSSAWKDFESWAAKNSRNSLPANPDAVAVYITELLNRPCRITTAAHRLTAIGDRHRRAGYPDPCTPEVRAVVDGAQRLRGEQPCGKEPLSVEQLGAIVRATKDKSPLGLRNRAILLFGFATALRRSTLVALLLTDLEFSDQGVEVKIRREKQDQHGRGRTVAVPYGEKQYTCPVRALQAWLKCRGSGAGSLFTRVERRRPTLKGLEPHTIGRVVKKCVQRIGLSPAHYAGHSLRAGFVTEALERGVGEIRVAHHTGHRSLSCLRRYYRPVDLFRSNACSMLGL